MLALFINGYLLLSFLFGEMGMLNSLKLKRTRAQLRQEIGSIRRNNETLADRVKALRGDPDTIESIARSQLGLVREGELVYEFYENAP